MLETNFSLIRECGRQMFRKESICEQLMYAENGAVLQNCVVGFFSGLSINKCLFMAKKHVDSIQEILSNNPFDEHQMQKLLFSGSKSKRKNNC
jgi:hypothetical protein